MASPQYRKPYVQENVRQASSAGNSLDLAPDTGYRFYDPGQLDQARLIAWLRRLGMPLARIRIVVGLDGPAAAAEVTANWNEVVAETAGRGRLASFLIDHLRGRGSAMTDSGLTLGIRYAGRADTGKVRTSN